MNLASFVIVSTETPEVNIRYKVNKANHENRTNYGTTKEFLFNSSLVSFTTCLSTAFKKINL